MVEENYKTRRHQVSKLKLRGNAIKPAALSAHGLDGSYFITVLMAWILCIPLAALYMGMEDRESCCSPYLKGGLNRQKIGNNLNMNRAP